MDQEVDMNSKNVVGFGLASWENRNADSFLKWVIHYGICRKSQRFNPPFPTFPPFPTTQNYLILVYPCLACK